MKKFINTILDGMFLGLKAMLILVALFWAGMCIYTLITGVHIGFVLP